MALRFATFLPQCCDNILDLFWKQQYNKREMLLHEYIICGKEKMGVTKKKNESCSRWCVTYRSLNYLRHIMELLWVCMKVPS